VFKRGLDLNVGILFLLKYFRLSNLSPTADRHLKVLPAAHLLRRAAAQRFASGEREKPAAAGFLPAASAAPLARQEDWG
jgi:hypothetical protein